MQQNEFLAQLNDACMESKKGPTLWKVQYQVLCMYQEEVKQKLGNKGFIMFTDEIAVLCLNKELNLKVQIVGIKHFKRDDFKDLDFQLEIIGKGYDELLGPIKQYFIDLKDNAIVIMIMSILYIFVFNLENINTIGVVELCENLLNIVSIFAGIVFVFIGFIYSDRERAEKIFLMGNGDKYYSIDKYIMNLLMSVLAALVMTSVVGKISADNLPQAIVKMQINNEIMNIVISHRTQYLICHILGWFSLCSIIICFRALVDYYLNDLRSSYFIDAVNKKSRDYKG